MLKSSGIRIVTVGNSVILKGADSKGTLNAVYEFLTQCFNYEYFADTAIRLDTNVTEVPLMNFDITDVPDFEFNLATYGYVRRSISMTNRYRMTTDYALIIPVGGLMYHNSFAWFPPETYKAVHPDWYSTCGTQLCYTARGSATEYAAMLATATETAKQLLRDPQYAEYTVLTLTQQDGSGWCTCSACAASTIKYNGSNAAVVIKFLNDLKTNIDAWFASEGVAYSRDLKLLFFGYHRTNKPPTIYNEATGMHQLVDETVRCVDGVGVYFAETAGDYTQDYFAEVNSEIAKNMAGYGCVTDDIFFWSYQVNFNYYLTPYNSFDGMQEIYQYAKCCNAVLSFNQGLYIEMGKSTAWSALKVYLSSKLAWDVNADMDLLIDEFFEEYFGPAAYSMRKMFDTFKQQAEWNQEHHGYTGPDSIYVEALRKEFWPERLLTGWLGYTDEALAAIDSLKNTDIASYNAYSENIRRERLSALYLLIELYGDTLSTEILQTYKQTFYNDATEFSLTMVGEQVNLETLYSKWGIQ